MKKEQDTLPLADELVPEVVEETPPPLPGRRGHASAARPPALSIWIYLKQAFKVNMMMRGVIRINTPTLVIYGHEITKEKLDRLFGEVGGGSGSVPGKARPIEKKGGDPLGGDLQ